MSGLIVIGADAEIWHVRQCPRDTATVEAARRLDAERQTAATVSDLGKIAKDVEHLTILDRLEVRANDTDNALGVAASDRTQVLNRIERVGDTQIDALYRRVETRLADVSAVVSKCQKRGP